MSDERVLRSFYGVVYSESSRVVQAEAGMDIISEVTVEGVQVLLQIHVKERQSPSLVVQYHANPHRVHCNPQVGTPAVVKKLIFMPEGNKEESNVTRVPHLKLFLSLSLILLGIILTVSATRIIKKKKKKQMLNHEPAAGFQKAAGLKKKMRNVIVKCCVGRITKKMPTMWKKPHSGLV